MAVRPKRPKPNNNETIPASARTKVVLLAAPLTRDAFRRRNMGTKVCGRFLRDGDDALGLEIFSFWSQPHPRSRGARLDQKRRPDTPSPSFMFSRRYVPIIGYRPLWRLRSRLRTVATIYLLTINGLVRILYSVLECNWTTYLCPVQYASLNQFFFWLYFRSLYNIIHVLNIFIYIIRDMWKPSHVWYIISTVFVIFAPFLTIFNETLCCAVL